jgi:polycomb protein SUZ12
LAENQDPPPKKKLRRSSEDKSVKDGKVRGDKVKSQSELLSYQAELVIYDKHKRCLLTDGEYECALEDTGSNLPMPSGKHSSWETVSEGKVCVVKLLAAVTSHSEHIN